MIRMKNLICTLLINLILLSIGLANDNWILKNPTLKPSARRAFAMAYVDLKKYFYLVEGKILIMMRHGFMILVLILGPIKILHQNSPKLKNRKIQNGRPQRLRSRKIPNRPTHSLKRISPNQRQLNRSNQTVPKQIPTN